MITTPLTIKAYEIAAQAHQTQADKSGMPYITHPIAVAEQMDDEVSTIAALLHDVFEDTDTPIETLDQFPDEAANAVKLLTRTPGEDYFSYIERLRIDPVAKKVKIADLNHNSDPRRAANINESLKERYAKALRILLGPEGSLCSQCRSYMPNETLTAFVCEKHGERCGDECFSCEDYSSWYIQYPVSVNTIENKSVERHSLYKCGQSVKVRVAGEKYTHFGILLGELPFMASECYNRLSRVLTINMVCNPAIYVPSLRKVVYGAECWWSRIDSEEEAAKAITDEEINNQWYMRLLRDAMNDKED